MSKLKLGILGHGFIGKVHSEVIEEGVKGLEVIAISDTSSGAMAVADKTGYACYFDYRSLLDKEKIDAAIVALPVPMHVAAVRELTERKIPFLLEKPMGVTEEEAVKIANYVAESKTKCMVGLTGRFHPEFTGAYVALAIGRIGAIVSMQERIHYGMPKFPRKYVTPDHSGRGIGLENGIHTFDRIQHFSDANITRLEGVTKSNQHLNAPLEDYVAGVAVTNHGLHVPFSLRWTDHDEADYVFQVTGTDGVLTVNGFDSAAIQHGSKIGVLFQHKPGSLRDRHKPGIKKELEHFARFLKGRETDDFIDDSLRAHHVVEMLYKK